MKRYKTRPGVVLTTIAGQNVLVAAKSVRDQCPYTAQINETAAFCWLLLEQGATLEDLARKLSEEYEVEDAAQMRADLEQMLSQLLESHYLIEEP